MCDILRPRRDRNLPRLGRWRIAAQSGARLERAPWDFLYDEVSTPSFNLEMGCLDPPAPGVLAHADLALRSCPPSTSAEITPREVRLPPGFAGRLLLPTTADQHRSRHMAQHLKPSRHLPLEMYQPENRDPQPISGTQLYGSRRRGRFPQFSFRRSSPSDSLGEAGEDLGCAVGPFHLPQSRPGRGMAGDPIPACGALTDLSRTANRARAQMNLGVDCGIGTRGSASRVYPRWRRVGVKL